LAVIVAWLPGRDGGKQLVVVARDVSGWPGKGGRDGLTETRNLVNQILLCDVGKKGTA
jgi:hypothetical protein